MNAYVIGLDGGGTKTLARVADMDGPRVIDVTGGGSNLCASDEEAVRATLGELLRAAVEKAGGPAGCRAVALGAAGCSCRGVPERLTAILRELAPAGAEVSVTSDWEIAVRGALPPGAGLVLNAGTGSFGAGRDEQGRIYRSGGGGHLLDDEGSGYALGRDGLRYLLRTFDNRAEPCGLSEALTEAFCLHGVHEVVTYAFDGGKAGMAAAAPVVIRQMELGDPAATEICARGVRELLTLFGAVRKQTRLRAGQVVLLGGMMEHHEAYRAMLSRSLVSQYPGWSTCQSAGGAAEEAIELALRSLFQREGKGEDSYRKPPDQDSPELRRV